MELMDTPIAQAGMVTRDITVEIKGELFGFEFGDTITCTCGKGKPECLWDDAHVLVRGFTLGLPRELAGLIVPFGGYGPIDYDLPCQLRDSGEHLELVRYDPASMRDAAGRRFTPISSGPPEVGDTVIAVGGHLVGFRGRVVAISSDPRLLNPYVVEFFHCPFGQSLIEVFDQSWYPNAHKTNSNTRAFMLADDLISVSRDPVQP